MVMVLKPRRTRGWWPIWGWAVIHNVWAAGRNQEMLSEASRRTRRGHPIVVTTLSVGLLAHLMGWLGKLDPLTWLGSVVVKIRGRNG